MMKLFFRQARIILLSTIAYLKAWSIKLTRNMDGVRFDKKPTRAPLIGNPGDQAEIKYILHWADIWVRWGAARTGRKCFFRAYIAGWVLHQLGYPVTLHVGLWMKGLGQGSVGHCWLTLNGHLLGERDNPGNHYHMALAHNGQGVLYWVGMPLKEATR
jgi:hypothetical protein